MRWFTSDLHFGHANILRFCDRPFVDVNHMNTAIVNAMNERVSPDDELWILGDVAMGNVDVTLPLVRRLTAGRVVIVAGNHDRFHPCNKKKATGWLERYERLTGAEVINGNTELTLTDGTRVQVSHFPYAGDSYDRGHVDRFAAFRPVDNGGWLLCGHVHEKWRQFGRVINVGVDAWGGWPVSESEIASIISKGSANHAAKPWFQ
jgi:calcineurin-like phosphoesterase family protein